LLLVVGVYAYNDVGIGAASDVGCDGGMDADYDGGVCVYVYRNANAYITYAVYVDIVVGIGDDVGIDVGTGVDIGVDIGFVDVFGYPVGGVVAGLGVEFAVFVGCEVDVGGDGDAGGAAHGYCNAGVYARMRCCVGCYVGVAVDVAAAVYCMVGGGVVVYVDVYIDMVCVGNNITNIIIPFRIRIDTTTNLNVITSVTIVSSNMTKRHHARHSNYQYQPPSMSSA